MGIMQILAFALFCFFGYVAYEMMVDKGMLPPSAIYRGPVYQNSGRDGPASTAASRPNVNQYRGRTGDSYAGPRRKNTTAGRFNCSNFPALRSDRYNAYDRYRNSNTDRNYQLYKKYDRMYRAALGQCG